MLVPVAGSRHGALAKTDPPYEDLSQNDKTEKMVSCFRRNDREGPFDCAQGDREGPFDCAQGDKEGASSNVACVVLYLPLVQNSFG